MMNLFDLSQGMGLEGFMHCNELQKLAELAVGGRVLEVGSFMGLSSWAMAITAKTLVCVDTFQANSGGQEQTADLTTFEAFKQATGRFNNVLPFIGTSEMAAIALGYGKFDLIFLDAMHDYESVKSDIDRWWPRVETRGIMAFHDYGHDAFPGVKQAVDERFGPGQNGNCWEVTLRWVYK